VTCIAVLCHWGLNKMLHVFFFIMSMKCVYPVIFNQHFVFAESRIDIKDPDLLSGMCHWLSSLQIFVGS